MKVDVENLGILFQVEESGFFTGVRYRDVS